MKIYFTAHEGSPWFEINTTRKEINKALKTFVCQVLLHQSELINIKPAAVRIGKSPIIYDFVLLKLNKQPWIRNLPNGNR